MQIMTFHLVEGAYAVELSTVVEVLRSGAKGDALGKSRSARPLPLFDLAERLGVPGSALPGAPALVLRGRGREVGVRVDRLGEVRDVADDHIYGLPRYFASPLLRAVAEVDDTLVVLLDTDGLVAAFPDGELATAEPNREPS